MTSITLKNVTKTIRGKTIFKDLNLTIPSKEVTVLFGSSGAGKTILLKVIAGTESVDRGRIYFDSADVTNMPPKKRDVAMVFQTFALYPHLTIYENIASPLRIKKLPENEIRERINEVAELLRIRHILNKMPSECSGGEAQRAAIARALVKRPKIYLFDAPLTNLDYKVREVLRSELKKIFREVNATVLYSTSNPEEAAALGDKLVYIKEGRVAQIGAVRDCFQKPIDLDAASHYSLFGINTLRATCEQIDSKRYLSVGSLLKVDVTGYELLKPGAEYIIGFYPHDIRIQGTSVTGIQLPISVEFLENMGSELVIMGNFEGTPIRILTSNIEELHELTKLKYVYIPYEKILIFSKENRELLVGGLSNG
jgi:ABC-type sugar transport system ATPase subunit